MFSLQGVVIFPVEMLAVLAESIAIFTFYALVVMNYTGLHMPIDNSQPPRWQQPRRTIDGFLGGAPPRRLDASARPRPQSKLRALNAPHKPIGAIDGFTSGAVKKAATSVPQSNNEPLTVSMLPTYPVPRTRKRNRQPLLSTNPEVLAKLKHDRKLHKLRSWGTRVALTAAAIGIVGGAFLLIKGYLQLHHVFQGGGTAAALSTDVNPNLLKGEGSGRINILLMGIGGVNHDGPDLTDTMLIASIDPVNNKAVLLSVPRDLWVKMPNNFISNYQKINAAYESGKYEYLGQATSSNSNQKAIDAGFSAVNKTVDNVLGITINYNVLVDFQAFQQAINTVGGVTVNVPTALYDPTMAWQNNWNPVLAPAGIQTMNGYKALLYVRSRETTSDFARTQRQRAVMLDLKQKVLSLGTLSNPLKISQLMSAFGDNIRTNISLNDAEALYALTKKISNNNVQSIDLATPPHNLVTTSSYGGLSIVEPTAGLYDYGQIQAYVRSELVDGYITRENANIMVLNGTTTPGLAEKVAALLKSYGYNVGHVGNAPSTSYQKTLIIDLTHGKDKYTSHYLHNRFHAIVSDKIPSNSILPKKANFVIILGNDAATNS